MKGLYYLLLAAAVLLVMPGGTAFSQLDYTFKVGTGSSIDMTGESQLHGTYVGAGGWNSQGNFTIAIDLPFTFQFNASNYSRVTVANNGVIGLGSTDAPTYGDGTLTGHSMPILAPFWDYLRMGSRSGAKTSYKVSGSAPKRIFVIAWTKVQFGSYGNGILGDATFQVRLYEGTNVIEFYYQTMNNGNINGWNSGTSTTSATIGIAGGPSAFFSVTPSGSSATMSKTSSNDYIDLNYNSIAADVMYTFAPCAILLKGNTAQGGTSGMGEGDQILAGKKGARYGTTNYTPFNVTFDAGCSSGNYAFAISGAAASEYKVTPTSGSVTAGADIPITVAFTPTALGIRNATLTVTGNNAYRRVLSLVGEGTYRLTWLPNMAQGGTTNLKIGDTLMNGLRVPRLSSASFTPITFSVPAVPTAPAAPITYTIVDPTNQYKIRNPITNQLVNSYTFSAAQGTSFSPPIVFSPTGVGYQQAQLTVNAEEEVRTFFLKSYSVAPGGDFYLNGEKLGPTSQIFQKDFICVGEDIRSYPIEVRNIGDGDFNVTNVVAYRIDTVYGQGTPRYPLLRDSKGNLIPVNDYFLTDGPGSAPISGDQIAYPLTTPYLTQKTIHFNYVPQLPGKRFARVYIYTNGQNFSGADASGAMVEGLLVIDLFGRGLGSFPTDAIAGQTAPKSVSFKRTMMGDTSYATTTICNSGLCDLRIDRRLFRISGGDVRDFRIVEAFATAQVDQTGEMETWVIPPDSCATVTFAFMPGGKGTRRSTIYMQTNDSASITNGLTERGAYYWDLLGIGSVGLEGTEVNLATGVIDGPDEMHPTGNAHLENTTRDYIVIDSLRLVGPDVAEFSMDPNNPWPATPFAVKPGEALDLGVLHTPTAGSQPGKRTAQIWLFTSEGDTIFIDLRGESGARTLVADPTSLFTNTTLTLGKQSRQTVMLTNNGTVPLTLGTTTISGPNANSYLLGKLPRLTLAPGQTEFFEVTFRPLDRGPSTATLTVNSDATSGPVMIQLGGTGRGIESGSGNENATSGVAEAVSALDGVMLWQTRPNPGRDLVEIAYRLEREGEVDLRLFDDRGAEIRTLDRGLRTAGDHAVTFRVDGLPNGLYHYRLSAGGVTVSRSMTVVR